MLQSDEIVPPALHDLMHVHGIEQIQEVPAVPAAGGLRYPRGVRLEPDGESWYLRSFGTDFRLIPRTWLRRGPVRCWSVGCDLDATGERDGLLLIQALASGEKAAEALALALVENLTPFSEELAVRTGEEWQRSCCWVAARLRPVGDEELHG